MGRIMDILVEECKKGGIHVDTMLSDTRTLKVVNVRHLAMWRARHELGESLQKIGRVFKRDHTSVMSGINRVDRLGYEYVAQEYAQSRIARREQAAQKIRLQCERRKRRDREIIYEHRGNV